MQCVKFNYSDIYSAQFCYYDYVRTIYIYIIYNYYVIYITIIKYSLAFRVRRSCKIHDAYVI